MSFGILVLLYFYSHYFFASGAAHIGAMFTAFLSVASALGTPPFLAAIVLSFLSNLMGGITHYGIGSAPVFYGANYVPLPTWWGFGFLVSIVNILIWLGVGGIWWKAIGLWWSDARWICWPCNSLFSQIHLQNKLIEVASQFCLSFFRHYKLFSCLVPMKWTDEETEKLNIKFVLCSSNNLYYYELWFVFASFHHYIYISIIIRCTIVDNSTNYYHIREISFYVHIST